MLAKRSKGSIVDTMGFGDNFWKGFRGFDDFFNVFNPLPSPAEFSEDENNYVLSLEIPGLGDDIKVTYENEILSISADKSVEDKSPVWSTRSYGRIERSYRLHNVDQDKIDATYKKGVLTVTLGKLTEGCPPRKEITVKCCD